VATLRFKVCEAKSGKIVGRLTSAPVSLSGGSEQVVDVKIEPVPKVAILQLCFGAVAMMPDWPGCKDIASAKSNSDAIFGDTSSVAPPPDGQPRTTPP
jgi:hypothetical protein